MNDNKASEDKKESDSLYSLLKQLASFTGDLSQISCPGFLLCGSSALEYTYHYCDYPSYFKEITKEVLKKDEKTLIATKWFLSSLFGLFRSRNVNAQNKDVVEFEKKPYNPILGEQFLAELKDKDGNLINLSSEQVSHHPPITSFCFKENDSDCFVYGHCEQKSSFKVNTIRVDQVGHIVCYNRKTEECFVFTLPTIYVRSLYTGKPFIELCGTSHVYTNLGYTVDIEYVPKPWIGGEYFTINAKIFTTDKKTTVYELDGKWTDKIFYKKPKDSEKKVLFEVDNNYKAEKHVKPIDQQSALESMKVWEKVSAAIKKQDYPTVKSEKAIIENKQRELKKKREEEGETWRPELFVETDNDEYILKVKAHYPHSLDMVDSKSFIPKSFNGNKQSN